MATIYNIDTIVNYCKKASAENWPYVRGGNGEIMTDSLLRKLRSCQGSSSQYGDQHFFGRNLIGKHGADCSGLIVGAVRSINPTFSDRNANTWYNKCTIKGRFNSSVKVVKGMLLFTGSSFKKGHVGIAISSTQAVEEKSTLEGCVTTNIASRGWTYYGYSDVFDYKDENGSTISEGNSSTTIGSKPFSDYNSVKRTSTYAAIKEVQLALQKVKNGRYKNIVSTADGIWGVRTLAAILIFQFENGLEVDGIFGKKSKQKAEQLL